MSNIRRYSPREYSYQGSTDPVDPERCEAEIEASGTRFYFSAQCSRKRSAVRTIRGEDLALCGQHAAAHDRALAKQGEHDAREERSRANHGRAASVCNVLATAGILAVPNYEHGRGGSLGEYDGRVLIDADDAMKLLQAVLEAAAEQ